MITTAPPPAARRCGSPARMSSAAWPALSANVAVKSSSAALWISYAYFRSYHDNVLIFYYFRDRNAANNGDPQTFAKVIASELDADVIVEKKN